MVLSGCKCDDKFLSVTLDSELSSQIVFRVVVWKLQVIWKFVHVIDTFLERTEYSFYRYMFIFRLRSHQSRRRKDDKAVPKARGTSHEWKSHDRLCGVQSCSSLCLLASVQYRRETWLTAAASGQLRRTESWPRLNFRHWRNPLERLSPLPQTVAAAEPPRVSVTMRRKHCIFAKSDLLWMHP